MYSECFPNFLTLIWILLNYDLVFHYWEDCSTVNFHGKPRNKFHNWRIWHVGDKLYLFFVNCTKVGFYWKIPTWTQDMWFINFIKCLWWIETSSLKFNEAWYNLSYLLQKTLSVWKRILQTFAIYDLLANIQLTGHRKLTINGSIS